MEQRKDGRICRQSKTFCEVIYLYPRKVNCKNGVYSVYIHLMIPTGKRYVGVTGQVPKRRFQRGVGYKSNERFWADIEKYGWDEVHTEIVAQTSDFELAHEFENTAIHMYDTLNPDKGYNYWSSGSENRPVESVGRHISEAKMGHSVSEETSAKLRKANNKPVVQMDLNGNELKVFPSIAEASKAVNAHKNNVWAVCNGRKHTCRGYKWKYA